MEQIVIKGKSFSKDEVLDVGRRKVKVVTNVLRWVGVGVFATGLLMIFSLLNPEPELDMASGIMAIVVFLVAGALLFGLSFIRRDPLKYGIKQIEKKMSSSTGFDGESADVLVGDKTLVLCKKPLSQLVVNSSTKQFQVYTQKHYSKIYLPNDLVDYEIRVDNEVVVTSKTKTKKGIGKSLIGGALFGGAGLVAGAVAGNTKGKTSSSQKEIHHYSLVIRVNDISKPSFVIDLSSAQVAEDAITIFDILVGNTNKLGLFQKKEPKPEPVAAPKEYPSEDKFEEIKKYKELLDEGIITKEEFEEKKKILLK